MMRSLRSSSPSQVKLFDECERKWYFRYVQKEQEPEGLAQILGTDIHSGMELYLSEGRLPDGRELVPQKFGKPPLEIDLSHTVPYVRALLPLLPKPREPGLVLELEHSIRLPQGIPYRLFIDFARSSGRVLEISDLKTKGNLKYVQTAKELETDIQMISYAQAGYDLGHKGDVDVRHIYVQTYLPKREEQDRLVALGKKILDIAPLEMPKRKLPNVLGPVTARVSRPHVEREWNKILKITDQMMEVSLAKSAQDVEPTGAAKRICTKYRNYPCAYLAKCGFAVPLTNLFQGLFPKKEVVSTMSSFKDRMKNLKRPAEDEEEVQAAPPARRAARGTIPPDAPSRTYDEADEEEAAPPKKTYVKKSRQEIADEVHAEVQARVEAAKRGRPKKVAAKAAEPDEEELIEEAPAPKKNGKANGKPNGLPQFELWIGCTPVRETPHFPVPFEDWFSSITDDLNARLRKERKINSYWALPYAEQKEAIAEIIMENLEHIPPALIMGTFSGVAQEAAQILIPYASQVHRSFR